MDCEGRKWTYSCCQVLRNLFSPWARPPTSHVWQYSNRKNQTWCPTSCVITADRLINCASTCTVPLMRLRTKSVCNRLNGPRLSVWASVGHICSFSWLRSCGTKKKSCYWSKTTRTAQKWLNFLGGRSPTKVIHFWAIRVHTTFITGILCFWGKIPVELLSDLVVNCCL